MIVWKSWSQAAVVLTTVLIAGCGGGGSSGDGSGDNTASRVIVSAPTPAKDVAPNIAGERVEFALVGTITGDFEKLQGKKIFVTVEDPAGLFQPTAETLVTSAGTYLNYRLTLRGKADATAGRLTGTLRIFVCLDQASSLWAGRR